MAGICDPASQKSTKKLHPDQFYAVAKMGVLGQHVFFFFYSNDDFLLH